jgi:AcrR family transcriptional regulator
MRERILTAAGELMDRFTVAKTTMDDVAKAAGIARQTVYKHFRGKEDLLVGLFVQQMVQNQHPKLRKLGDRKPSVDNLVTLFLTELELARQFSHYNGTLDPQVAPQMAELVFHAPILFETRESLWLPILDRYRDAGVLRPELDPRSVVRWITYQEFWLLTHPSVLCENDAELRYYAREFIVGALVHESALSSSR